MGGYGLLGQRLSHSFSPRIHGLLGKYPYRLIELEEAELARFMRENRLDGFNVTIPYKQAVIPFLDGLSDTAKAIGSVNTVIRQKDGCLFGDNSDAWGFEKLLSHAPDFVGQKALILGSGGSSKTVRAVLEGRGMHTVVISRSGENHYGNLEKHRDAVLIVNTTPVGMYPNNGSAPLSLACFPDCRLVIDLIYNPRRTALMMEAEALGIEARGGLLMLAAQAQRAAELWGVIPKGEDRSGVIERTLGKAMLNIALIGMPGCGKSEVARALGKLTGRMVFDTDEMIEKKSGLPVPQLIAEKGIEAFRQLESEALAEAGRASGAVIATGGGVVCEGRNLPLLRQNSAIIWLERALCDLPVSGRPLSQGRGVEALYHERKPLYKAWSERSFYNDGVQDTARRIMEEALQ